MLAGLAERHHVEREVELTIAGPREPMTHHVAARRLDQGHPVIRGEARGGAEALHIADPTENLGGQD
jgi:hypothetical protein